MMYKTLNTSYSSSSLRTPKGTWLDKPIAALGLLLLAPVAALNVVLALTQRKALFTHVERQDSVGRKVVLTEFNTGFLRTHGRLWNIMAGNVNICGFPIEQQLTAKECKLLLSNFSVKPGLTNLVSVRERTGLAIDSRLTVLEQQFAGGTAAYIGLILKACLCWLLYNANQFLRAPTTFKLFGITVNNDRMTEAVDWLTTQTENTRCETAVFVNVNSINLAFETSSLKCAINSANRVFCDGSGMRMAASAAGFQLKDNINGTDLLPFLCERASAKGKSLFLLGSSPGVAAIAAGKLKDSYPSLNIAGHHHGYFDSGQNAEIIEQVNQSRADILLIALGSPKQEQWLIANASKLNCSKALAVGGLLDFFSGRLPRAPLWMREIGLEWLWRLLQEPKSKFHRYVIGNPLFLYRVFILNQAKRGI